MSFKEKQEFVDGIINSVRESIFADFSKIPEEWGAIQLRMLLARRFENQVWRHTLLSEKRDFENDLDIYGL